MTYFPSHESVHSQLENDTCQYSRAYSWRLHHQEGMQHQRTLRTRRPRSGIDERSKTGYCGCLWGKVKERHTGSVVRKYRSARLCELCTAYLFLRRRKWLVEYVNAEGDGAYLWRGGEMRLSVTNKVDEQCQKTRLDQPGAPLLTR